MKINPYLSPTIVCAVFLHLIVAQQSAATSNFAGYSPKPGDIVFQSFPHSPLTDMIEGVTESAYSHCGIVAQKKGQWKVIEAVGPVREVPLTDWIQQGRERAFAVYRLKQTYSAEIPAFLQAAEEY